MNSKPIKSKFLLVATLGLLSMLTPLAMDMYLPSFLDMAGDLNITVEQVQHTLTFFAYGLAAGQLFWGPFGDSFGRKPIILLGVIISALISLVLTEIYTIENFSILRFLQGFFGAAPVVLAGALLRDLFNKNELSKVISTITLVFMLAPLIAPIMGGYIAKFFHWKVIFYVICLIGIFSAVLVWTAIPETHKKENRSPLRINIIIRNFISLFKEREVLGYLFALSFSFAGIFAFITAGSIVYIGIYHVPQEQFGYYFILNVAMMSSASILNGKLVTKMDTERVLKLGLGVQLLVGIWLILTGIFDFGFWSMAIGIALFAGQGTLIAPNATVGILEKYPQMAGTANALLGSVRFGMGAVVSTLVAMMKMDTALPMLMTMGVCAILSIGGYYFLTYLKK